MSTGKWPDRSSPRARRLSARCSSASSSSASAGGRPASSEAAQILQQRRRDRLLAEVPDHGAQLGLRVEGQAVVDRVDPVVRHPEAVAALAVGVVGHQVEEADALERLAVLALLQQREVVLAEVGRHEELERPLSERPLPLSREGHQPPAERLREEVGGDLAPVEPGREIPQRPLAALRLVHRERGLAVEAALDQEGGVAAAGHAPLDRDLPAGQQVERDGRVRAPRHG